MAKGKKDRPDYVPAGAQEAQSNDPTDEYASAVDNGKDFTQSTDPTAQGLANQNEQTTGASTPY